MRRLVWIPLAILVFGLGCGAMLGASQKHGKQIDREKLEQIVKGQTTMEEVEGLMGKPQAEKSGSEGTSWTYQFLKVSAFGGSTNEAVEIVFRPDGIVADIRESSWSY